MTIDNGIRSIFGDWCGYVLFAVVLLLFISIIILMILLMILLIVLILVRRC